MKKLACLLCVFLAISAIGFAQSRTSQSSAEESTVQGSEAGLLADAGSYPKVDFIDPPTEEETQWWPGGVMPDGYGCE